jgi:hypothetical protein
MPKAANSCSYDDQNKAGFLVPQGMSALTVGVALITFNRPDLLREALRSIQKQTRRPDEVFISDNSTCPDENLVAEFPDLPIRYHFHDRRLAIDEHWLWCLQQPQSDLIALLEDDNLMLPRHLEVLARVLEKEPSVVLVGTSAQVFSDLEARFPQKIMAPVWPFHLLERKAVLIPREEAMATYLFGTPFASSALMIRRTAFPPGGFVQSGLRISHDRWMWAQIAIQGEVAFDPEITMLYREHAVQVVKNFKAAQHRQDTAGSTQLIWNLIQKQNLNWAQGLQGLAHRLDLSTRRGLSYLMLRSRSYQIWRQSMPHLLPAVSLGRLWIWAVQDFVAARLRSWWSR